MENFTTGFENGFDAGYAAGSGPSVIGLIIGIIIFALLIKGVVQTFQRNWIAAILLMIFVGPVYMIWVVVEVFRSKPQPKVHYVEVKNV